MPEGVPQPVTVAWFFSYLISIWMQHWLHNTLVYGWSVKWKDGECLRLRRPILPPRETQTLEP